MTTTTETNVSRIRQFCQLVQQEKRIDLFDEYIHPEFQDHPLSGGTTDRETARGFMKGVHAHVDDLEVEVITCVEGDGIVATHKIFRGVLNADFLGFTKGQRLNLRVMDFMRMRDGKAVEHWATQNPMGADA